MGMTSSHLCGILHLEASHNSAHTQGYKMIQMCDPQQVVIVGVTLESLCPNIFLLQLPPIQRLTKLSTGGK